MCEATSKALEREIKRSVRRWISIGRRPMRSESAATKERSHSCFEPVERLVWTRRGLESSLAVNQKNSRIARDVPIEVGNLATDRKKGIAHDYLLDVFPLEVDIFVGQSKNDEPLVFMVLV